MKSVRTRQDHNRADAGFSLIEVLVALALLALLLAAMPSTLQLGRRAWESSETIDRAGAATIATSFLQNRIAQAMPLQRRRADGSVHAAFDGRADTVTFVAPSIDGPPGTGLFIFTLTARVSDNAQSALVLQWRPYQSSFENDAQPIGERVLLSDSTAFGLRYLGRHTPGAPRGWTETWQRIDALPELVELRIRSRSDMASSPPPTIIELLAQNIPRYE